MYVLFVEVDFSFHSFGMFIGVAVFDFQPSPNFPVLCLWWKKVYLCISQCVHLFVGVWYLILYVCVWVCFMSAWACAYVLGISDGNNLCNEYYFAHPTKRWCFVFKAVSYGGCRHKLYYIDVERLNAPP